MDFPRRCQKAGKPLEKQRFGGCATRSQNTERAGNLKTPSGNHRCQDFPPGFPPAMPKNWKPLVKQRTVGWYDLSTPQVGCRRKRGVWGVCCWLIHGCASLQGGGYPARRMPLPPAAPIQNGCLYPLPLMVTLSTNTLLYEEDFNGLGINEGEATPAQRHQSPHPHMSRQFQKPPPRHLQ